MQKNVRTADWKALQGSVEDLTILSEKHKDINVRKMSEKLRQVIATHGAVLMETEAMRGKTDKVTILIKRNVFFQSVTVLRGCP